MERKGLRYYLELQDGTFGRGIDNATKKVNQLDQTVNRVGRSLAGAFAISGASNLIRETTELRAKMEGYDNVIKFASRNSKEYNTNLQFIRGTIAAYKLPMTEALEGFSQLMGAMKGTSLEGSGAREVYKGIAAASTTLHMSQERTQRVTMALSQIMSKGKLQAEELTQQLGESLPGANLLAAKAMGVTTQQLAKMMANGQVLAEDFLPKFARELQNAYGPGVQASLNSTQAKLNEVNNRLLEQKNILGTQLTPAHIALQQVQAKGLEYFSNTITFMREHDLAVKSLAFGITAVAGSYVLYRGILIAATTMQALNTAALEIARLRAIGLMGANAGLATSFRTVTASLAINPWAIAAVGVGLLATGIWAATHATNTLSTAINNDAVNSLFTEKDALEDDIKALRDSNISREETLKLIEKINAKHPEYLSGLNAEELAAGKVADELERINRALDEKIIKTMREKANEDIASRIGKQFGDINSYKADMRAIGRPKTLAQAEELRRLTGNISESKAAILKLKEDRATIDADILATARDVFGLDTSLYNSSKNPFGTLSSYTGTGDTPQLNDIPKDKNEDPFGKNKPNTTTGATTGTSGRGGAPIYVTINQLKAADNIVLENGANMRATIEKMVTELLMRSVRDFTALQ